MFQLHSSSLEAVVESVVIPLFPLVVSTLNNPKEVVASHPNHPLGSAPAFDRNKLPLIRTLAIKDTNSQSSMTVSAIKEVDLTLLGPYFY